MNPDLPIKIRPIRPNDIGFVVDTWVQTLLYSCDTFFVWPQKEVKEKFRGLIERLLEQRSDLFEIACDEVNEDTLFGWSCHEGSVVHFFYVKADFRGLGVGKGLIDEDMFWNRMNKRQSHTVIFSFWSHWCNNCKWDLLYEPRYFRALVDSLDKRTSVVLNTSKQVKEKEKLT